MKKKMLDRDGQLVQIDNRIFRLCIEPESYDSYEKLIEEYSCNTCDLEDCPSKYSFSNSEFSKSYCHKYIKPEVYTEKLVIFKEIKGGV